MWLSCLLESTSTSTADCCPNKGTTVVENNLPACVLRTYFYFLKIRTPEYRIRNMFACLVGSFWMYRSCTTNFIVITNFKVVVMKNVSTPAMQKAITIVVQTAGSNLGK